MSGINRRIAIGVVKDEGKAVIVELVLKTLDTEPCPQCGNPVLRRQKICSICGFNMMAD